MWRISKETTRIKSIKRGDYEIDSVIIIPGVCSYETIYTKQNFDRFFTQITRENKINQILGDTKDKK